MTTSIPQTVVRVYGTSPLAPFPHEMMLEMVQELRSHRAKRHDPRLDTVPDAHGTHLAGFSRNYALLRIGRPNERLAQEEWRGSGWIGVSGLVKAASASKRPPFFLRRIGTEAELPRVDVGGLLGQAAVQEVPYSYTPWAGKNCAEPPLINAVAYLLREARLPSDRALEVFLLSERFPCPSCIQILSQFRTEFPNIRLHLLYLFDHDFRVESLVHGLSDVVDSIHLVEYVDGDDKGFNADEAFQGRGAVAMTALNVMPISALKPEEHLVYPPTTDVLPRAAASSSGHFVARLPTHGLNPGERS